MKPRLLDAFCGAGGAAMGPETERAWAAGFFDGEGYVGLRRDKRPGRTLTLQLSIEQVDPRPLQRFIDAVGWSGHVGCRSTQRAPRRQVIHRVHLGHVATMTTMAAVWPWLSGPKREQLTRALEEIDGSASAA